MSVPSSIASSNLFWFLIRWSHSFCLTVKCIESDPNALWKIALKGSFSSPTTWMSLYMSNKEVLKVWKYWILEKQTLLDIIILSFAFSYICWLSDLARLKIDWTCQILNLYSLLPTHFLRFTIGISTLGVLNFLAFFLVIKTTMQPESLLSVIFWCFAPLFVDSLGLSDSISLYFLLFPMVLGCKFKIYGKYILLIQNFRLSNNKNSIKFVKMK